MRKCSAFLFLFLFQLDFAADLLKDRFIEFIVANFRSHI